MSNTRRTGTTPEDASAARESLERAVEALTEEPALAIPPETKVELAPAEGGRRQFTVTDRAGPRVAGHLVDPESSTVFLTEHEAAAELLDGTIVPKGEELHRMFSASAKAAS